MQDSFETTSKGTAQDTRVSARRRLVGGAALSVPVALTLRSGGAAAASVSCVFKQVRNGAVSQPNVTTDDNWLRVRLWALTGQNANFSSTWISGADLAVLAKSGKTVFISATEWWCMSAGSSAKIQTGPTTTTNVTAGNKYTPNPVPPRYTQGSNTTYVASAQSVYVSVRVDEAGNIVGVVGDGQPTTGTSSVSDSCWTSFAG